MSNPPTKLILVNTPSVPRRVKYKTTQHFTRGILADPKQCERLLKSLRIGTKIRLSEEEIQARWILLSKNVRTAMMKTYRHIPQHLAFIQGRHAQWYEIPGYQANPSPISVERYDKHIDRVLMLADYIRRFPYASPLTNKPYTIPYILTRYQWQARGIDTIRMFREWGFELTEEHYGDYGDARPWHRYGYMFRDDHEMGATISMCAKWAKKANYDIDGAVTLWYASKVAKHREWLQSGGVKIRKDKRLGYTTVVRSREPRIPSDTSIKDMRKKMTKFIQYQEEIVWSYAEQHESEFYPLRDD